MKIIETIKAYLIAAILAVLPSIILMLPFLAWIIAYKKFMEVLNMKKWSILYCVGNTYKYKFVYAENANEAIKKSRIKNIIDLNIVDENNNIIG